MSYENNPPGWYHAEGDPPASQRWWDGSQWVGGPAAAGSGADRAPAAVYPPPAYGGYGATPGQSLKASWWVRFGAALIDGLILGVPFFIINRVAFSNVSKELVSCTVDGRRAICERPTGSGFAILGLVWLAQLVIAVVYYAHFHGKTGQTIGKKAVGIAVVDIRSGAPIGTGRAVGRYFGSLVSMIPCLLGYLWAAWDSDKQTWHDKMVSSIVIQKNN